MAAVSTIVFAIPAVLRRAGVAGWLVNAATVGALVATLTFMFGRGSGLLWLIPTPNTFGRFQQLVEAGIKSIREQGLPAQATDGVLFLLAAGVGLIAILMDVLAISLRWPALSGLPLLVPVAVPGLLVGSAADAFALVVTSVGFLAILRVDALMRQSRHTRPPEGIPAAPGGDAQQRQRPAQLGGSIVIGSLGIVSALTLGAIIPVSPAIGPVAGSSGGQFFFGGAINPMIDLGKDLRRPNATAALHYMTTASQPPYFKLLTLDQFVGTTWAARSDPVRPGNTVDDIDKPLGLSADVESTETTTAVTIDRLSTRWLPAPTPATNVEGLTGTWGWGSDSLTILSTSSTTRGQEYTVTALNLKPTAEQLRASGTDYPVAALQNLELPTARPTIVDETAKSLAAGTASKYDAAVALQNYLRSGEFSYDTESPVEDGYDGGGLDVIGKFLEVKRGYCVQFASTMAVMARVMGIPARVALGYLPGTPSSQRTDDPARYDIDSDDLHTWPELYFGGVGWVPFEPTPSRGAVPAYSRADATPPTSGPARPNQEYTPADLGALGGSESQLQDTSSVPRLGLILAGALAVVLLLVPGVMRRLVRERRRRRIRLGQSGALEAWAELTDTALDHGVQVRDTETPREFADHLEMRAGTAGNEVAAALGRLVVVEERYRYARPERVVAGGDATCLADDLDRLISAVRAGATTRERVLATALPASLWRAMSRWRAQRDRRTGRKSSIAAEVSAGVERAAYAAHRSDLGP